MTYARPPGRYDDCLRCDEHRRIKSRGLCTRCWWDSHDDGTLDDYGYVKTHRIADYTQLRREGATIAEAARRVGVTERTGWRYETENRRAAQDTAA